MSVRCSDNVGRAVQTNPTLLRYASAITEQNKCWELLAEKFDWFQTLRNNTQQGVQTDATCNIQQCWKLLVNNVASVCTQPKEVYLAVNHFFFLLFFALSLVLDIVDILLGREEQLEEKEFNMPIFT